MELQGKVALITGGGSGIGKATAKLFAEHGAKVAVLGHTREGLDKTAKAIEADGGEALVLEADITDEKKMEEAVQKIDDTWGRLDAVVANAGINGTWAPVDVLTPDDWRETIDVNLNGTFLTLHYAVPLLKRQGGAVVITSSINGTTRFTGAGATAYASTKAAQLAMGKMLALELAKHKVRVNVVCPGDIDTSIEDNMEVEQEEEAEVAVEYPDGDIPLTGGEPGTSEQVADLMLFLCSDRSSHITGTPVWIDGAESLLQG